MALMLQGIEYDYTLQTRLARKLESPNNEVLRTSVIAHRRDEPNCNILQGDQLNSVNVDIHRSIAVHEATCHCHSMRSHEDGEQEKNDTHSIGFIGTDMLSLNVAPNLPEAQVDGCIQGLKSGHSEA